PPESGKRRESGLFRIEGSPEDACLREVVGECEIEKVTPVWQEAWPAVAFAALGLQQRERPRLPAGRRYHLHLRAGLVREHDRARGAPRAASSACRRAEGLRCAIRYVDSLELLLREEGQRMPT